MTSLARLGYIALIGLQIYWHAVAAPAAGWVILIAVLPLVLALKLVLAPPRQGRIIAAMLTLPWFAHGLSSVVVGDRPLLAMLECGLVLIVFVAVFLERVEPAAAPGDSAES